MRDQGAAVVRARLRRGEPGGRRAAAPPIRHPHLIGEPEPAGEGDRPGLPWSVWSLAPSWAIHAAAAKLSAAVLAGLCWSPAGAGSRVIGCSLELRQRIETRSAPHRSVKLGLQQAPQRAEEVYVILLAEAVRRRATCLIDRSCGSGGKL